MFFSFSNQKTLWNINYVILNSGGFRGGEYKNYIASLLAYKNYIASLSHIKIIELQYLQVYIVCLRYIIILCPLLLKARQGEAGLAIARDVEVCYSKRGATLAR